jgi:hypothetical protein
MYQKITKYLVHANYNNDYDENSNLVFHFLSIDQGQRAVVMTLH